MIFGRTNRIKLLKTNPPDKGTKKKIMKIIIRADNDSEWLDNTNFIILSLSDEDISKIKDIQQKMIDTFPYLHCIVNLYDIDFKVYDEETIIGIPELCKIAEDYKLDTTTIPDDFDTESIPDYEKINGERLDGFIEVSKDHIQCLANPKHDGSVEVFSTYVVL